MTGDILTLILVAFYLFLAVRWQNVRRNGLYVIGVTAVLISMLAQTLFLGTPGPGIIAFGRLVLVLANMAAFGAGIGACYGRDLPAVDRATVQLNDVLRSVMGKKQDKAAGGPPNPPAVPPSAS